MSGAIETGYMECTSCHNVHDNALRPFLRPGNSGSITRTGTSKFCNDCHDDRLDGLGSDNHPVDIQFDRAQSDRDMKSSLNALLRALPGTGSWSLGGKLSKVVNGTTYGAVTVATDYDTLTNASLHISCQSCHSIHKPDTGAGQLLAMANTGSSAGLCEGCHSGGTGGGNVGTGNDHPIDTAIGTYPMLLDNWASTTRSDVRGSAAGEWPGRTTTVICTSCHSAHRTNGTLLNRQGGDGADFCKSCHSSVAPAGHHSCQSNWATSALRIGGTGCPGVSSALQPDRRRQAVLASERRMGDTSDAPATTAAAHRDRRSTPPRRFHPWPR